MWKLLASCCALLAAAVVLALGGAAEAKIKVAFVTSESGHGRPVLQRHDGPGHEARGQGARTSTT